MKVYQTNEIKNIALLGASGSGKSTLAESMLYEAGVIKRRGSIQAKNTVSDYFPVELEYGYSVFPLFPRGTGIWLLRIPYRFSCRMEQQKAKRHRLPGS